MMPPDDRFTVRRIPLCCLHPCEAELRVPKPLKKYIAALKRYPHDYAGMLFVEPSDHHAGMFRILDGTSKFAGCIFWQRADALCVIIEPTEKEMQES